MQRKMIKATTANKALDKNAVLRLPNINYFANSEIQRLVNTATQELQLKIQEIQQFLPADDAAIEQRLAELSDAILFSYGLLASELLSSPSLPVDLVKFLQAGNAESKATETQAEFIAGFLLINFFNKVLCCHNQDINNLLFNLYVNLQPSQTEIDPENLKFELIQLFKKAFIKRPNKQLDDATLTQQPMITRLDIASIQNGVTLVDLFSARRNDVPRLSPSEGSLDQSPKKPSQKKSNSAPTSPRVKTEAEDDAKSAKVLEDKQPEFFPQKLTLNKRPKSGGLSKKEKKALKHVLTEEEQKQKELAEMIERMATDTYGERQRTRAAINSNLQKQSKGELERRLLGENPAKFFALKLGIFRLRPPTSFVSFAKDSTQDELVPTQPSILEPADTVFMTKALNVNHIQSSQAPEKLNKQLESKPKSPGQ